VPATELRETRDAVAAVWDRLMGNGNAGS